MSAKKVRIVTATGATITGREELIVFNAAGAISFDLGPSYGDGRSFDLKNIGAGAVTLVPYGSDVIWDDSSIITKSLAQGESINITDSQAETWVSTYTDFETTPITEGGTGISGSGVTKIFYVDGGRSDTYTEDGSILRPYKTILAAQNVVNTASALLLDSAAHFELCKFIVNIAPGKYTDNVAISTVRYLRWNMEGVEVSGNVTITQNQLGLTDYYGKVEFFGGYGNRAYRGNCGLFSGTVTFLKDAYDSLAYDAFIGCSIAGNLQYGTSAADTHGTWVLCLINSYFPTSSKFISAYLAAASENVLIESYGYNKIVSHIAKQDGSATKVALYDCNETYFGVINLTPVENCRVKNCTFNSTTSIVASKVLSIDDNSYKSLSAVTPTLTGMAISYLDAVAANISPVVRTNNPVVAANQTGTNIDLLDAAIGADPVPVARTTGPIAVANNVNQNLDALDSAIGFEGQMSGTPHVVTFPTTIFQALDKLDTYKSVQTIKKTIGGVGVAGCDFNFATAADQVEQVINLGAIVPAKARIVDVFTFTNNVFTGAVSLVAETGTSSSGAELIGSATIYAADAITAAANAGAFIATPAAAATSIYVSATPGANWSNVTAGKVSVYITFINVTNI